jgi:Tfp pilus assembly protein PilO
MPDKLKIDLNKIKKEYLFIIFGVLIIFIAFFAYKAVFSPLLGKIRSVSAQIEVKKGNIRKAKISPDRFKELEEEIEGLKPRIDYYYRNLQALPDIPQILKELNRIGERLKIKFVSIHPLEREETLLPGGEESLLQIPIKLNLKCGYHQLGIFVNELESPPRFMKIRELKINTDPKNVWMHQAELVITSYMLVDKGTEE